MMRSLLVVALACGCGLFPLFPPKPVFVTPPPATKPAGMATKEPQCALITDIAPLSTFYGDLPVDVSEDAAYNAALQFLVTTGDTIESQDPIAHTIVTKRRDGQTWLSTCPVNRYFMYSSRVAIVGRTMIVSMECRTSLGWEAHIANGVVMPRNRGELAACTVPTYVSKGDARLPFLLFDGTIAALNLRKLPPLKGATETAPRWWCYADRYTCFRDRDECTSKPKVRPEDCKPRQRAYCTVTEPRVCFGDLDACHFDGGDNVRQCVSVE